MTDMPDHTIVAIMDGHAGSVAAVYTSQRLRAIIEETAAWVQYKALPPKKRAAEHNLISKALVEAYRM